MNTKVIYIAVSLSVIPTAQPRGAGGGGGGSAGGGAAAAAAAFARGGGGVPSFVPRSGGPSAPAIRGVAPTGTTGSIGLSLRGAAATAMLRGVRAGNPTLRASIADEAGVSRGSLAINGRSGVLRDNSGNVVANLRFADGRIYFYEPTTLRGYAVEDSVGMIRFYRLNEAGEYVPEGSEPSSSFAARITIAEETSVTSPSRSPSMEPNSFSIPAPTPGGDVTDSPYTHKSDSRSDSSGTTAVAPTPGITYSYQPAPTKPTPPPKIYEYCMQCRNGHPVGEHQLSKIDEYCAECHTGHPIGQHRPSTHDEYCVRCNTGHPRGKHRR